ncbi:isocitrate lyase/PEP mutase family protein [Azospirillum rugosum]|uniref:2-methylisocitrate lyase-like PEP mutase family enzyme n=1 Tax=Azospirillum rugosum TaxID=416170 RepID=A0ABS4SUJ3_9PROT|nr:isocitrate lyase/PEP mutase family protein [Azospirillum rugosum]MBP2296237.1 2-methylisocitrate lyase-like PEP mutase family enzyme [Azospirillum rugosum]MDQ0529758.1 2-methylisocitrate lyase-like PEP mutase family enzyme [Azospirillum rugosum]
MQAKSKTLKARLAQKPTLVVPDAYDALSARLIERAGFEAVQCSGYSMAIAQGYAAETNLSYSENLEATRRIVNAVTVPVMADGEDGFGDKAKLEQVVREFIGIGAAGINLEDQVLGRWGVARAVVDADEMVEKLRVAMQVRQASPNPDFVLNARTDALATAADRSAGLEEAVRRANQYLAAGADLAFVTGVRTLEEARFLKERIDGPLTLATGLAYNLREMPVADLVELGLARVSLPTVLVTAVAQAVADTLAALRVSGTLDGTAGDQAMAGVATIAGLAAR